MTDNIERRMTESTGAPRPARTRAKRLGRVAFWTVGAVAGLTGLGAVVGCCVFSAQRYAGERSDHFDGERFINRTAQPRGFRDLLKWMSNRSVGPWREWVDARPGPRPVTRSDQLLVTFVNHSTLLIQVAGLNILTDPVWSKKVGPAGLVGPERHRPPGIRWGDLPPIDLVLLSHNHYDHMDLPTLRALARVGAQRFVAPLGNAAFLMDEEITPADDLDWWQRLRINDSVSITCVPAEHFSGRGTCDRDGTLWGGFVIETPQSTIYFAGDTGWGPHFEEIGRRFGRIDVAMLPIGAYRPRWFMAPVHIDPQDAVRAHLALGARTSIGMHFGTFVQADDGETEPVEELRAALAALREPRPDFRVPEHGVAIALRRD